MEMFHPQISQICADFLQVLPLEIYGSGCCKSVDQLRIVLPVIHDGSRRTPAQFQLVGHFLEACSESFNLLLLLRGSRFGTLTLLTIKLAE
jgi:hypothetical protein